MSQAGDSWTNLLRFLGLRKTHPAQFSTALQFWRTLRDNVAGLHSPSFEFGRNLLLTWGNAHEKHFLIVVVSKSGECFWSPEYGKFYEGLPIVAAFEKAAYHSDHELLHDRIEGSSGKLLRTRPVKLPNRK